VLIVIRLFEYRKLPRKIDIQKVRGQFKLRKNCFIGLSQGSSYSSNLNLSSANQTESTRMSDVLHQQP
jgi:hypothetical protein